MKVTLFLVLLTLAVGCAAVGLYDEPYALFEVGFPSAVRKELPLIINAVDGQSTLDPRRSGPIKPGKHQLDLEFSTRDGPYWKRQKTVELDAAHCTRYRIVAHYDNLTHVEWTPVIYPEPIGECLAKFQSKG
jgi:hypothetical protein